MRSPTRQWSRTVWGLGLLLASLPVAGRLVLGSWGFADAAALACLCFIAGTYLSLATRRRFRRLRDPAAILGQALEIARSGRADRAIELLTRLIQRSPKLWQARQYRGELYLAQPGFTRAALDDFEEAIRLAPEEQHLYELRARARTVLGGDVLEA